MLRKPRRGAVKPIELNMGAMWIGKGLRSLRLRSDGPVALDQIRLQPEPKKKRKRK